MSTVSQTIPTESDALIQRMLERVFAFQSLLREEQEAIRCLSFGQFTSVTMRKTQLLDEIRDLEQERRTRPASTGSYPANSDRSRREQELVAAIGETDRLNRFNATLIGQSLEFLHGTLKCWQRSPESAALYSSSGTAVAAGAGLVRAKG
ncbi:MAG: flagellar protein FlgN [Nitrospira sp.]|nr:flagellar protein FlgN [Nitrospira sp.]